MLEVQPEGGPPFEATVKQVLPFMMAGSPSPGTRLEVRYLPAAPKSSVHILGPVQRLPGS